MLLVRQVSYPAAAAAAAAVVCGYDPSRCGRNSVVCYALLLTRQRMKFDLSSRLVDTAEEQTAFNTTNNSRCFIVINI